MPQPIMTRSQIEAIIPHRDPMLLVDEVLAHEPGKSIATRFYVSPDRAIFAGHFPGDPVLPGVYTVECMAQTADLLLLSLERYAGKTPLFLGIDRVSFLSRIDPGDTVEITARLTSERVEKAIATCSCEVRKGAILAATGDVTLALR